MSYPKFGTHPITCGKRKCKWTGYETDLTKGDGNGSPSTCPVCGSDGYYYMSEKQMKATGLAVKEATP